MNRFIIAVAALAVMACLAANTKSGKQVNSINPVIGNASWMQAFGRPPAPGDDEKIRIKTHLLYAENLLRNRDKSSIDAATLAKREHLLNLLHQYAIAGAYPQNYDHPEERKPCFIDRDGSICAVGYLVEQTAGRAAAEQINAKYQYATIEEMKDDAALQDWIAQSGLTEEECAIIQPTYNWPGSPSADDQHITTGYGISSGLLGGCNIAINAINQYQVKNGSRSKLVPLLGIVTGGASIFNGIHHFPNNTSDNQVGEDAGNPKRLLSAGNIALGTATVVFSTWNLIKNKKRPAPKTSWAPFTLPAANGKMAYGLCLTKKIG